MNKFSEKDWKLFRNKISDWKEAYMEKLNKEYVALLSGKGNASDKFWKLEKRIREDKKDCGVQCEMSRSNQFYIMLSLLNEGAITFDDLEDFMFRINFQKPRPHKSFLLIIRHGTVKNCLACNSVIADRWRTRRIV